MHQWGKKAFFTAIMRMMGQFLQRPQMGQLANTVRANVETAIRERQLALKREALEAQLNAEATDITLPGRRLSPGTQHLIEQVRERWKTPYQHGLHH